MSEAAKHKIFIKAVYPETLVNTGSRRWMLRRASLYERFQSAASHFICVFETVLNFWRPLLSSSTNTSHPLRGSLSSFGANPATSAFLQALFNWFHLTQTSDGVSFTELRDTGPPLLTLPLRGPPAESVQELVWDFSRQSVAGHLHSPSLWIGPPVAAPGRVPWCLYQTVKRDSPRLQQVPESQSNSSRCTNRCSFTSTKLQRSEGRVGETEGGRLGCWALQSVWTNSLSWGLGLICMATAIFTKRPLGYLPRSLNYWGRAGEWTTSEEVSSFCSALHFFKRNFPGSLW